MTAFHWVCVQASSPSGTAGDLDLVERLIFLVTGFIRRAAHHKGARLDAHDFMPIELT